MAQHVIEHALVKGEVSPELFGRFDEARMHVAAATMRNMFVSYRGGAYSRAGTAFVGYSKQTGRAFPPRMLPFQFNNNQGLCLEFGNLYMRVIRNGAFVADLQGSVTNVAHSNPAVVTASFTATGAASATPNIGAVSQSYAPGEVVTLAGGAFTQATQLQVLTTLLESTAIGNPGSGWVPGDTIAPAGGTQTTPVQLTVSATQVSSCVFATQGAATVQGIYTMQGTTGTGAKFQVQVVQNALGQRSILGISFGGNYTVNPTLLGEAMVQVAGPGAWTGLTLNITMGVLAVAISNAGVFTANPPGGNMTLGSTSGAGVGVTFTNAILAPNAVRVAVAGVYTSYPANPVAQASSSGAGRGATFNVTTTSVPAGSVANGDWVFLAGIGGMTALNGNTYVAQNVSGNAFSLFDVFGNAVDSTGLPAYTAGGSASRIYTLPTIYGEQDLKWLKFTESADQVSIGCVNQVSFAEYPPQDLTRFSDANWSFQPVVPGTATGAPANVTAAASSGGTTNYAYAITAIGPDGSESLPAFGGVGSAVNVAGTAGTITVSWQSSATPAAGPYYVYKATPGVGVAPGVSNSFGFAGIAFGNTFLDSNVVPDFSQTPPLKANPFARGKIQAVRVLSSTGTVSNVTFTIGTSTGSGAVLIPVIVANVLTSVLVLDGGAGYGPSDTITGSVTGGGAVTLALVVGPQTGTYPGVVAYFQQRRAYAYTLNQPDTYFMSQPGLFTNFDVRNPTIASDAISGSPWEQQVNGIQFMIQTAGGLLVFTGLSTWLLVGTGSFATNVQPISPSSQVANPQPEIGCSSFIQPIKVDYNVLFADTDNNTYYDQPYQLYALSPPEDITTDSNHLLSGGGFAAVQHAWCRKPNKLLWVVRDDGAMLSLTYLRPQQVLGWARHDTQGTWQNVAAIREAPVDALYLAAQRRLTGGTAYTIERMDNRRWLNVEDCWCVDMGFSLAQPAPAATLTAASLSGLGSVTGVTNLVSSGGWSASTQALVTDGPTAEYGPIGPGIGATAQPIIAAGVIAGVNFPTSGQGYVNPQIAFFDPQAGNTNAPTASARCVLNNAVVLSANANVFANGNVGSYVRMNGGKALITGFIDAQHVNANVQIPFTALSAAAGNWTMTAPVASVTAPPLAGMTVTGLYDGNVLPPTQADATGRIALPANASQVTIGLGFQAQLQSVYLDTGNPTVQARRKKIAAASVLLQFSRGVKMGSNQPDGSTLSPPQIAPPWTNLDIVPDKLPAPFNSTTVPLYTGYQRVPIQGGWQTPGQVCLQQDNPLPMNVLALVPEVLEGDLPDNKLTPKPQSRPEQRRAA